MSSESRFRRANLKQISVDYMVIHGFFNDRFPSAYADRNTVHGLVTALMILEIL